MSQNDITWVYEMQNVYIISGGNLLTALDPAWFGSFTRLVWLAAGRCEYNHTTMQPGTLPHLHPTFEQLHLQQANLYTIPDDIRSLTKLIWLDVSQNHISFIPPFMFANNTKLNWLFLDHNHLTVLPENMFLKPCTTLPPPDQLPPLEDLRYMKHYHL